ncbi:MAG: SDR family oxidoreductase, partial [Planctomycetaceae bacterium]|nr:SDR family oxidoreductase [Planctomycetaceae bacterium]
MARKFTDDGQSIKDALATISLRKVASPQDIANATLFLASSQVAGHITGQALTVSGGMEGRKLYAEEALDLNRAIP